MLCPYLHVNSAVKVPPGDYDVLHVTAIHPRWILMQASVNTVAVVCVLVNSYQVFRGQNAFWGPAQLCISLNMNWHYIYTSGWEYAVKSHVPKLWNPTDSLFQHIIFWCFFLWLLANYVHLLGMAKYILLPIKLSMFLKSKNGLVLFISIVWSK